MTPIHRTLLFAVTIIIAGVTLAPECFAQTSRRQRYTAQQRSNIRATPILERPSRTFHFYGNAVRRNADVAPGRAKSPTKLKAATSLQPSSAIAKRNVDTPSKPTEVQVAHPVIESETHASAARVDRPKASKSTAQPLTPASTARSLLSGKTGKVPLPPPLLQQKKRRETTIREKT